MKNNLEEDLEINPMNNRKYIEAVSFRDWQTCDLICDEHSVLVGRIKRLEQELQKTREQLSNACSKLKYATNSLEFANSFMDEDEDDVTEMNEWITETRGFIKEHLKDKQGE